MSETRTLRLPLPSFNDSGCLVGNPAQALWLKSIEVFNEQGFVDVDPLSGQGYASEE